MADITDEKLCAWLRVESGIQHERLRSHPAELISEAADRIEQLAAEVERMRPVVEAAVAWQRADQDNWPRTTDHLDRVVRSFLAQGSE